MAPRLDLHELLKSITDNVYFQPPPSIQMQYPCIVYNREADSVNHADDIKYARKKRYQVTVIDRDPDSGIPDEVSVLPFCVYDRFYAVDNLNHDVFRLFF